MRPASRAPPATSPASSTASKNPSPRINRRACRLQDWHDNQDQLRAALYNLRGQIEKSQHDYDAAAKDLHMSYAIHPSAMAAEQLGELAEMRRDSATAIDEYMLAFVLPENGPAGKVNRREVRKKLGNVWRQVHGNEDGLGQAVLAAYDLQAAAAAPTSAPAARNKEAKEHLRLYVAQARWHARATLRRQRKSSGPKFLGHLVRTVQGTRT